MWLPESYKAGVGCSGADVETKKTREKDFNVLPDPIDTLCELVSIPSVNPMGRAVLDPPYGESRLTDALESILRRLGLPTERQLVEPGRENVIALLEGDVPAQRGGPLILLEAHQDTVPVDGMTIDPFQPQRRDGRVYGRGACDTKGGMAAMLAAIARLAHQRPAGMPSVLLACTVNEEYGFTGAVKLAECFQQGTGGLVPRRPDCAVVAEPTALDVVVAHKGMVRWRCRTQGRAAHSAHPEAGRNAIYLMGRVLSVLEEYACDVVGRAAAHPLCGPATLSVGTIHGGMSVNTVPDACVIEIDRRMPPGETAPEARQAVIEYLHSALGEDFPVVHDPTYLSGPALSDAANGPLAERLMATVRGGSGRCQRRGVSYGTHAAVYAAAGVPSVVFGPGFIEQAHTRDEWVDAGQVRAAAEVYYNFCRGG